MSAYRTVFFISDRTGITAEGLGRTLITQFDDYKFTTVTLPYIDSQIKAEQAKNNIDALAAKGTKPLIFSTIVDQEIRSIIRTANAVFMDFFDSFIPKLEQELDAHSSPVVGKSHGIVDYENYSTRIEAVNFALNCDDGSHTKYYQEADVILLGVSRSGKTPTCLYMALLYGVRAANYPITEEDMMQHTFPKFLKYHKKKIVGLTIEPDRLHQIREQRQPNSTYASMQQCRKEITMAENLFKLEGSPFLNSTHRSIEEIATQIMILTGIERRLRG